MCNYNENCIMGFEQQYLMIVLTTMQWNYGYLVCGWSKVMFLWYFIINEYFEPMLVLQIMTVLCNVSRVLKNETKVLLLVQTFL